MNDARGRPRGPYVLATIALLLGFAAVWALSWLLFGFGTCGEDSEISAADYARLCEGGRIARNLMLIGVAALAAATALGAAAIHRRAARPVLTLTALLSVAGVASFNADVL
jgi:hypothetical protein